MCQESYGRSLAQRGVWADSSSTIAFRAIQRQIDQALARAPNLVQTWLWSYLLDQEVARARATS